MSALFDNDVINSVNPGTASGVASIAANQGIFDDNMIKDVGSDSSAAKTETAPVSSPSATGVLSHPLRALADPFLGVGETIANAGLGTVGTAMGGLAGIAGGITGGQDQAERWNNWAQRNISTVAGLYDPTPQSTTGKEIQDVINAGLGKVKSAGEWIGGKTLAATGSPLAATAADVGTQTAIQVAAGVGAAKVLHSGGISGNPEAIESTVDQGRGAQSQPVPLERTITGGGAADTSLNPYPELTGQKNVRNGDFPMVQASQISGDVPASEQMVRSQIAGQILGPDANDRIRPSVITGNSDTGRTEAALANAASPTPQGILLRDKMAEEQRSLQDFSDGIVNKTGALPTLLNDGQRGDLLNSALYGPESLRSFIDSQKNALYAEADQRLGPNPVQLGSLEKTLSNPQLSSSLKIAGLPNFVPGVAELLNQFKTNGFENPVTGAPIAPNTVAAAMELRKALNSAWTPDNSAYVGRLKGMIDQDVASAGGADLYQKANAIHAAEQNLFNAPGVKKIFGDADPITGISKGVSSEKILPSINNLPFDQYANIHNIFDTMSRGQVPGAPGLQLPPELQMAGAQSKAEMAGALTRDVSQAGGNKIGAWNPNAANKTMNAYSQKINLAVYPDVIQDLHTLNLGGQIMPHSHAYEGAALQARRLDQSGLVEKSLPSAGAVIGGALPIPGGAWLGGKAGEWAQGQTQLNRLMNQASKTDAEMEAAAKLGK